MCKYSLLVFHTLILYNIIDIRYVNTGSLFCLSLFLLLYIEHANTKSFEGFPISQIPYEYYGTQLLK